MSRPLQVVQVDNHADRCYTHYPEGDEPYRPNDSLGQKLWNVINHELGPNAADVLVDKLVRAMEQQHVTKPGWTPLRRGTAKRLGITQPTEVVMTIHLDLTAWARAFAKVMRPAVNAWQAELEADEAAVRASLQRFTANTRSEQGQS